MKAIPNFDGMIKCDELDMYRHKDRTWAFCQILDSDVNGTVT